MRKYRVKGTGEIVTVVRATSENEDELCSLIREKWPKNKSVLVSSHPHELYFVADGINVSLLLDGEMFVHAGEKGTFFICNSAGFCTYEELKDEPEKPRPISIDQAAGMFGLNIPLLGISAKGGDMHALRNDATRAFIEWLYENTEEPVFNTGKKRRESEKEELTTGRIKADIYVFPEAFKEIEKKIEEIGDILDGSVKVGCRFEPEPVTKEELEEIKRMVQYRDSVLEFGATKNGIYFKMPEGKESSPYVRHYKNSFTGKYVQVIEVTTRNIDVLKDKINGMLKEGGFVAHDKIKKELRVCLCPGAHITHLAIDKGIFLHFEGGEIRIEYFPSLPGYEYNPMSQQTAEDILDNIAKTHQYQYEIHGNLVKPADTGKGILTPEMEAAFKEMDRSPLIPAHEDKPHEKLGITDKEYDTLFKVLTKTANDEIAKMKAAKIKGDKSLGQLVDEYMASGSKSDGQKKLENIKKIVDSTLEDYYW